VTLEILDSSGALVRKYSSVDESRPIDASRLNIPAYWVKPAAVLANGAGMHRWIWDLHYPAPAGGRGRGAAGGGGGFGGAGGAWALPGEYTVKLTANGQTYTQPLTVKMDPRVPVSMSDLQRQFETARSVAALQAQVQQSLGQAAALRGQIGKLMAQAPETVKTALQAFSKSIDEVAGAQPALAADDFPAPVTEHSSLLFVSGELQRVSQSVNAGDAAPTDNALKALAEAQQTLTSASAKWDALKTNELGQINTVLKQNNLPELSIEARRE